MNRTNTEREYGEARVLVVEDERPLREAVRGFLEAEGYAITTASDGVEALDRMNERRPDVIVADIGMPRMDGYAFYEAVRSRHDGVQIPFIFLSARGGKEDIRRGRNLGAEDYITKPFHPEDLSVAIRTRLRRLGEIREATETEFEQLKQQIVTALGHELRVPLTHIIAYADIALEEADSCSADGLRDFLLAIKRGSDRLNRLVEDLLLIIRLDTGQAGQEFSLLAHVRQDISGIISRTVSRYEPKAQATGLSLVLDLDGSAPMLRLWEPFFCDALGRLIENAIKFSRGADKSIAVRGRQNGIWFTISVTDEGIGIEADQLPHLFERFRQIDRRRLEQQGVGLGLAIAHDLIQLHGGDIVVESEPGAGSVFTIRIPLTQSPAAGVGQESVGERINSMAHKLTH